MFPSSGRGDPLRFAGPTPSVRALRAGVGAALGAVVMVGGTFAPWLKSGEVERNCYRTAGLLQRLLGIDGTAGTALDALPLLAVLCAALGAAFLVGARVVALLGLSMLGLACAALAVAALGAPGGAGVRVAPIGPIITLLGSIIIVSATAYGVRRRSAQAISLNRPAPPRPPIAGEPL